MRRIVAVSNRVPALGTGANAGGLAVGVRAALEESGGLWFGWSGDLADDPAAEAQVERRGAFTLATVDLTPSDYELFYEGFSNRTLWPLLHGRLDLMSIDAECFAAYQRVNETFARKLAPLLVPGDWLWIHDYHLIPLGAHLRRLGVAAPQGFFLHVPFPPADVFAAMPWHAELLRDLCAYDLVGFQTERDHRNFRDFVGREQKAATDGSGSLRVSGRRLEAGVFPIGIDTRTFVDAFDAAPVRAALEKAARCRADQTWMLGVDRLDYTKGLSEKFRAVELLLQEHPQYRTQVSLIQVAAPSREGVPEYLRMRAELESLSGRINGRFAELDWLPIRFINRTFGQGRLAALYRLSRTVLVTPLCDGLNMVAKEYVAAQDPDNPGVLLLSRFAGAAERMDGAVVVNPYDVQGLARDLRTALEMPLSERQARWRKLMTEVEVHDVHDWRRRFLSALDAAAQARSELDLLAVSGDAVAAERLAGGMTYPQAAVLRAVRRKPGEARLAEVGTGLGPRLPVGRGRESRKRP